MRRISIGLLAVCTFLACGRNPNGVFVHEPVVESGAPYPVPEPVPEPVFYKVGEQKLAINFILDNDPRAKGYRTQVRLAISNFLRQLQSKGHKFTTGIAVTPRDSTHTIGITTSYQNPGLITQSEQSLGAVIDTVFKNIPAAVEGSTPSPLATLEALKLNPSYTSMTGSVLAFDFVVGSGRDGLVESAKNQADLSKDFQHLMEGCTRSWNASLFYPPDQHNTLLNAFSLMNQATFPILSGTEISNGLIQEWSGFIKKYFGPNSI